MASIPTAGPVRRSARWALRLVPVLALLWSGPVGAEIYRWTDAEGREHFTERLDAVPPAHRMQALRNTTGPRSDKGVHTYSGSRAPGAAHRRAAPARRAARGVGREIAIPFVRDGSLMRVEATLNDLVRVPFLIDTGASGVSIPAIYAERLGIRIRSDTEFVEVRTANGVVARPLVPVRSVQVAGARVENLKATVNPSMEIGLLGGDFFNNFIYRVDAARGVMTLVPNENIRGGLRPDQWRDRFLALTDPLKRLDAYLDDHPDLSPAERAELSSRRLELVAQLEALDREASRLGVPQIWRR